MSISLIPDTDDVAISPKSLLRTISSVPSILTLMFINTSPSMGDLVGVAGLATLVGVTTALSPSSGVATG